MSTHTNQPSPNISFVVGAMELGGQLQVRQLVPPDHAELKDLRLEALKNEGEYFGPLYEVEAKMTDAQWIDRCTPAPGKAIFGLFRNDKLIGMMSARPWEDDKSGQSVLWGQTYLNPEYRGRKLAAYLYEAREEWSATQFKRAVMFILQSNKRSQEIHLRNGATLFDSKPMFWPGRPSAVWNWYEKRLSA